MTENQQNNPLHGIKLQQIVTDLVDYFDWDMLGELIPINCFLKDPWARKKVEELYIENIEKLKSII